MKYLSKTQEVDLFWLRGTVQKLGIELKKVDTSMNPFDMPTMPLCRSQIVELREKVRVVAGARH